MLSAIIVDDEQNGREILETLLTQNCPNINVVAIAATIEEAVNVIVDHNPEIVFLDIELEKGTGFDILSNPKVQKKQFNIIFTTAYEQYAIKAIKNNALDYLLKPIDTQELIMAVNKVSARTTNSIKSIVNDLKVSLNTSSKLKLVNREGFELVDVHTILYCKSEANYTRFYFENGKTTITSKTLKVYQLYLEQHGFMRIHKSHIINLNMVKKYVQGKGGQVTLSNEVTLDISKDLKTTLLRKLEHL
ncbi:LytTR family DNA-binding domain-containing protein [Aquimarina sp. 2201CG1-2-11]|uniref:LytR/AlgR family response regulator transcription factor n=1 Tax=Aquimarina discodermiae TaxID=3231043 RepID=UPI00346262C3